MAYFEETFTIGDIVRKEIEVIQGNLLEVHIAVPGGTSGKTYGGQFQHTTYVSPTVPTPVTGIDLAGLFTIAVQDDKYIKLSTTTSTLLPGRYLYGVRFTQGLNTNTSSLREFLVLPGAVSGGGSIIQPGVTTAVLIAQHNDNPLAHNGLIGGGGGLLPYTAGFTQADLSTAGILVKLHGLSSRPSTVSIFDSTGELVNPSETLTSTTAFSADLYDYQPLVGTWLAMASV